MIEINSKFLKEFSHYKYSIAVELDAPDLAQHIEDWLSQYDTEVNKILEIAKDYMSLTDYENFKKEVAESILE